MVMHSNRISNYRCGCDELWFQDYFMIHVCSEHREKLADYINTCAISVNILKKVKPGIFSLM